MPAGVIPYVRRAERFGRRVLLASAAEMMEFDLETDQWADGRLPVRQQTLREPDPRLSVGSPARRDLDPSR